MKKSMVYCFWIAGYFLSHFAWSQEATEPQIPQEILLYEQNREAFRQAVEEELQRFSDGKNSIESELKALSGKGTSLNAQISNIQLSIRSREVNNLWIQSVFKGVVSFLYPEAAIPAFAFGWGSDFSTFVLVLLGMLLIWLTVLYFAIDDKIKEGAFRSRTVLFYCLFGLSLALISVSASAQEEDTLSQDEKLSRELAHTNKILSLSDHERYIRILESEKQGVVSLPNLKSGSQHLRAFPKVSDKSAEYYFTLAALKSYVKKDGEAVDALKKLKDLKRFDSVNRDYILVNSVKFLIQHKQSEAASELFQAKLNVISDSSQLLALADFMNANGYESSAEKALGHAINNANTSDSLIELSDYFYSNNRRKTGLQAVQKAFIRATTPEELTRVSSALSKRGELPPAEKLYASLKKVYDGDEQKTGKSLIKYSGEMIDAISVGSNKEQPRQFFKVALTDVAESDRSGYIELLNFALSRNWLEQAANVSSKFARSLDRIERFTYTVRPTTKLAVEEGIPSPSALSLPVMMGLIQEQMNFDAKAKRSYSYSITDTLNRLQQSYGSSEQDDLNSFYLLGRLLKKENNIIVLSELDTTYTLIEKTRLKQLVASNDEGLRVMDQKKNKLLESNAELVAKIDSLRLQDSAGAAKTLKLVLGLSGTFIFALTIVAVCVLHSSDYAKKLTEHRFYGFTFKFFETIGWVKVCSILSAFTGLGFVLLGQLGLIPKRIHEEVKLSNLVLDSEEVELNRDSLVAKLS